MEILSEQLSELIERLENSADFREELERLVSIYPFSKYEYIISTLLAHDKLSFDEYLEIRDSYISRNLFLYVFEITAPRGFGDTWAFGHLAELEPEMQRPNKTTDPVYKGEYDLFLDWEDDKGKNTISKLR